jgi:prepilin-type N-terminal cleavage/methylation domain-containing protein
MNSCRAFTLIELLVAAAITALLSGFIFIIVHNVSTTWTRSAGRLGADAQARLVLDQLALDLQGAMFRDDGNVWMAVNVLDTTNNAGALWQAAPRNPKPTGGLSLTMNTPNLADAHFGHAGVWLRFFTTSRSANTATANISAPVAVGYQIIRRYTAANTANLNTAYVLNRAESRPGASGTGATARPGVLESGYNITAAAYTTSSAANNNGATTGDPRSIQVPGSATGVRNLDSILADNVIDFGVRCYVHDQAVPGGLRLIFPATATGALANAATTRLRASLPSTTPPDATNFNTLFPDVVDVMVRVLTDDGAQQIANMEKNQTPALTVPVKYNSNAQQWWWGVAQENSRVYTRRIVLNAKSL